MRSAAQRLQDSAKRAAKKKEDAEWKALQELQNNEVIGEQHESLEDLVE